MVHDFSCRFVSFKSSKKNAAATTANSDGWPLYNGIA